MKGKADATFDYIVVGGGSAGSVLAGRLSEAAGTSVALLEAGAGKGAGWLVRIPTAFVLMMRSKLSNWAFETEPQPGLGGRRGYQPRGKGLGGSSAINAMVYIRGHRWDYDHWAELGNPGWSYDDVLPYFRRSENNERIHDDFHGSGGPLNVADPRTDRRLNEIFLEAARQVGLKVNSDFNGAVQDGVGDYQVTQKDGQRCSAAQAFLLPHIGNRDNLHVRTDTTVLRIIFEGRRAVGVECRRGGKTELIRARREVV